MSKRAIKIWTICLAANLILNVLMHFCISCNATLNYLASIIAAFALAFFVQEYHYGKNER